LPEAETIKPDPMDKNAPTAILTVPSFSGYGIHHLLAIMKLFPTTFKNVIFVSVGAIDSGNFKGADEMNRLREKIQGDMKKYMAMCHQYKLNCDYRMELATEPMATVEKICRELKKEFPSAIIFAGKLIFRKERWYQRILHSETALAL